MKENCEIHKTSVKVASPIRADQKALKETSQENEINRVSDGSNTLERIFKQMVGSLSLN